MPRCYRCPEHAFAGADCQDVTRLRVSGEVVSRSVRAGLVVLGCIFLGACTAATPAPAVYAPPPKPAEQPRRVHHPAPKPAAPAAGESATEAVPTGAPGSAPAGEVGASPASAPEGTLPAAAQSPADLPPPGGLPHDPSEYIEPPAR